MQVCRLYCPYRHARGFLPTSAAVRVCQTIPRTITASNTQSHKSFKHKHKIINMTSSGLVRTATNELSRVGGRGQRGRRGRRGSRITGCQRAQSGLPERARFEPASIDALTCPLLEYICIPTDTSVLRTEESVGLQHVPPYGVGGSMPVCIARTVTPEGSSQ